MSDSLTRLILRAQGRSPARPATAEPLLTSRYESDPGPVPGEAKPWVADPIDADPAVDRVEAAARRAASDPASPRVAQPSDDRMSADRSEPAGNGPKSVPGPTMPAGGSTRHPVDGRAGARADAAHTPVLLDRPSIRRRDDHHPESGPRQSSAPSHAAEQSDDARDASPQPASDAADHRTSGPRIIVGAMPAVSAPAAPRPSRTQDPAFDAPTRAQSDPIGAWTAGIRDEPTPPPDVRITIGVVEVHAVPPRSSPSRQVTARRPGTSLAEYLGQRAGRSS